MKKITSFILSVLMILSCTAFVSAAEVEFESGKQVAYVIGEVGEPVNGQYTVPIYLEFSDDYTGNVNTGAFQLKYDTEKLTYVSATANTDIMDIGLPGTPATGVFGFTFTNFMKSPITAPADGSDILLASVVFEAKENVYGEIVLEFNADADLGVQNAANSSAEYLEYQLVNGKIVIPLPKYNVTYTTANGTAPEAMADVESGTEITLPTLASTETHRFMGWTIDGDDTVYTDKYTVTADTAFTAVWEEIIYYTVTFDGEHEDMTVEKGTVITLPEYKADYSDTMYIDHWFIDGSDDIEMKPGDQYTVVSDVDFKCGLYPKPIVKFSEGADAIYAIPGTEITLPALTDEDLAFVGWKAGDTDEILAGGAVYTVTADDVTFNAVWGGAKKVYVSASGSDENNGYKADAAVATMAKAYEIINAEGSTIEEIVIIGTVEVADTITNLGTGVKNLKITGSGTDAVLSYLTTNRIFLYGTLTFENITIRTKNTGELAFAFGLAKKVVINEGVTFYKSNSSGAYVEGAFAASDYTTPDCKTLDLELEINKDPVCFAEVYLAGAYGGGDRSGKVSATINGGTIGTFLLHKGSTGNGSVNASFKGTADVTVNGGKITTLGLGRGANHNGTLAKVVVNAGEIGTLYTAGINHSYATWNWKDDENEKAPVALTIANSAFVYEINGGTIGTIGRMPDYSNAVTQLRKEKNDETAVYPDVWKDVPVIVIFNNGTAKEVADDNAIVLNAVNATLHADASIDENYVVTVNGISYVLPEAALAAEYNAVRVGDTIYRLDALENNLIPVPENAGVYEVEFINAYYVTIGEETVLVKAGDTVALTRLPQDGSLKHIGWATVEGAAEATINHTTDYAPTADVTLYPVWAEAVYFTVSFETAHGIAPEAISAIDDNEDGVADTAVTLPGYAEKQDEHFTFIGWTDKADAEKSYNAGDTVTLTGNITLVAQWTEDPKATVTYADDVAEATPAAVTDYVGTEITIAAPGTAEGLEFLGWINGENVYQAGDKLTLDADGITLTAKWGAKITVDVQGAKGTAPVIGGTIGETITLPTAVELTKINSTFKGFALSADGEIITEYTVNPEDTLYVIWEETVADAGLIKTKVTYYTGSGTYNVDVYFYGKDANTVAFGYKYGENLELTGFAPADGISVPHDTVTVNDTENRYYATAVANESTGKIAAADKTEENAVHLGTLIFTFKGTKEDYAKDDANDNIALTAPDAEAENISSSQYFLYVPAVTGLEVKGLPVVFDEAIDIEIIDVVYTVKGAVKVVRADGTAPRNFATVKAVNAAGVTVKTFTIENAETTTEDGVFTYEIELPEGEYTLVFEKTGYLDAAVALNVEAQEGADQDGFVPTPVEIAETTVLTAGDVVADGVIDLLDFAGITQVFGAGELADDTVLALDIDEDGSVSVYDLNYVKVNFGEKAE